jgi:hypothetical protein
MYKGFFKGEKPNWFREFDTRDKNLNISVVNTTND